MLSADMLSSLAALPVGAVRSLSALVESLPDSSQLYVSGLRPCPAGSVLALRGYTWRATLTRAASPSERVYVYPVLGYHPGLGGWAPDAESLQRAFESSYPGGE